MKWCGSVLEEELTIKMVPIIDNEMLWHPFKSTIDMLDDALRDCIDEHTLFWLDLYLTGAEEGFASPAPVDLVEMDRGEVLPWTHTREELLQKRSPLAFASILQKEQRWPVNPK